MAVNRASVSLNDRFHSGLNETRERQDEVLYVTMAWIIAVLLVSILGNSFVIAAFFRDSRLKVIFNLFVVHLATADIVISVIVILALVDELTQISLLGTWTSFCQLCAVFANAVPVEQLILVHIMCHDRHKALQRGMSYVRNSFHWHIEKLILFLTWVITLVGAFLMTDLMSSVKLFGYNSCRFPGRLLYMSYTSFLHFAMLVSLAVAVLFIIWEFRKQRKSPQFERLSIELEDGSPFLLTCRASAGRHQNKPSLQSLIPRSPLQVFRNFVSFPSPELHRPSCFPNTGGSSGPVRFEDVPKADTRHPQIPYMKDSSILDEFPACSYAEISSEALRFSSHGAQSSSYHERLPGVGLDEDLMSVGDLCKDDLHKHGERYMMCELNLDRFQHKGALSSTDSTRLHGDGCSYDTAQGFSQGSYGVNDDCVQKLWPVHAESQYKDSRGAYPIESVAAKGEPVALKSSVTKEKYEHGKDNQEAQGTFEISEDTDERVFAESLEDLLPVSVSLSDDELADMPQLHLRPRTDSLYTLRSGLSVSEESLSKTLDELMDVSSQSEVSVTNGMSEVGLKLRKEKRHEYRLFTIGDEEEEMSESNSVCDSKSMLGVFSRTECVPPALISHLDTSSNPAALINCLDASINPAALINCLDASSNPAALINCLDASINPAALINCLDASSNPAALINCLDASSNPAALINCLDASINPAALINCLDASINPANLSGIGSSSSTMQESILENGHPNTEKHQSSNKALSASEDPTCLSDSLTVKAASDDNSFVKQELSVMPFVESEPHCSLATADNNVDTQVQFLIDENTTRDEVYLQLPEQILQISHQVETQHESAHPHEEWEYSETDQDNHKNNEEDENNSAGKRKATDKKLKSQSLEKRQNNLSHTAGDPVSGDNIYTPAAIMNNPEHSLSPGKARQLTNEQCLSITADSTKSLTSDKNDHVKLPGRNITDKHNSVTKHSISYVRGKSVKDSKLYVGTRTYNMNDFDVFSAGSSENVNVEHSQQDIENAVESWMQFYGISPRGQLHRCQCEIDQDRKLLDERCRFPQQCKNFIPQPGHSMMCNSLVRARQLWLDFYGIEMVDKTVPAAILQPNGHLLTVPVEVHAAYSDSWDGSVVDEKVETQLDRNSFKQGLLFDPAQMDEAKTGKRLKRVIKYKNDRPGCEVSTGLSSQVCVTKREEIPENFEQISGALANQQTNTEDGTLLKSPSGFSYQRIGYDKDRPSGTAGNVQRNTEDGSLRKSLSDFGYQGIGCNKTRPGGTTQHTESVQILQLSNFVNQAQVNNDLPSHRHTKIHTSLEDNLAVNDRSLSPQNTEMSSNPDFNCSPAISFDKKQTVHSAEESSFLENTSSKPSDAKPPAFSCIFSLENEAGCFECYSKELEDQIAENAGVDDISGKEFAVSNIAIAEDNVCLDELERSSREEEMSFVNICDKQNEDQIGFTELKNKYLVDIPRSTDCRNDCMLGTSSAQDKKQGEINYHFIKSTSDSYVLGKDGQEVKEGIPSGKAASVTETAVSTYQILESLSITGRALLVELGIYQDILEGVIPLDKEVACQKEMKWMTPCPDCERRQQENVRKVSGTVLGAAQGIGSSSAGGAGAGQSGDVSWSALTDSQANNSSGLHHLTIDELKSERRSALGSEGSSLGMDMFQDLEEEDLTRNSESTSRADLFIRMLRRLPSVILAMSRKCSIEELKGRDPELCILLSLICIVMLQLICWLPMVVLYMVYDVTEFPPTASCMELIFLLLWCSRMAIQPVLYAFYSKYFHQNYIELICCRRCR